MPATAPIARAFDQMDCVRSGFGVAMDGLGFGPVQTPSRVVFREVGVTLKGYHEPSAAGPVVLIVPAPIKRAYIWDVLPHRSAVRRFLRQGLRVYMIHWHRPGDGQQGFGLAEYADRLILDCLGSIQRETGQSRVFVAGHSLGGTLAAIFAALHPRRVRGLVLLESPLKFGPEAGAFAPLIRAAPPAPRFTALLGNVPGSFLDAVSYAASPRTFERNRWRDWLASLPDLDALRTHILVARWTLDEMPLAKRLFEEIVDLLYREDRFVRGTLMVGGRTAAARQVEAPAISVVEPESDVVPPESVLAFYDAVRCDDTSVLWYEGDVGVALQHVGVLVGRGAHRVLWPQILRWIDAHRPA